MSEEQTPEVTSEDEAEGVEQDLDALLAETQKEQDEYLDLAKRTKADFENFRKRMTARFRPRGRGKARCSGGGAGPRRPGAGSSGGGAGSGGGLGGRAGAWGAARVPQPAGLAGRNGVEAVDPKGEKFDPKRHEALSTVAARGPSRGPWSR